MTQHKRVVVTGLGVVSPVGSTLDTFWAAIQAGQSGIGPITYFDASAFDTKFAGQVKGLNLDEFIPKKEQRRMDPFCHYGVAAAKMAVADSGLDMSKEDPTRIGVIAASGVGGLQILQSQMDVLRSRGPGRFSPFMIPQMITNILPGLISINHGMKGPNFAIVTACASGTHCIGESLELIRRGKAIQHTKAEMVIGYGWAIFATLLAAFLLVGALLNASLLSGALSIGLTILAVLAWRNLR